MSISSEIITSLADIKKQYNPSKNMTRNEITRFERAKVIGLRLEQLARGAEANIKVKEGMSLRDICISELENKKTPFIIVRLLANGTKEYWKIEDLKI